MTDDLKTLADRLLGIALGAGAEAADVLATNGTAMAIDVRQGKLEQAERQEGTELGLRVLIGRRQACVAASDTREPSMRAMAERAVAMAREAPEDPGAGLADPGQITAATDAAALEIHDPAPEPDPARLQDMAARAEAAALAVKGVSQVQSSGAQYSQRDMHLVASNGFSGGYARTSTHISTAAISGEGLGMEREFAGEARIFAADLPTPEEIGQLAGTRAVAMSGAKKPPTGAFPVVFDERVSSSLIGHLLGAINGMAIARGASWLRDAMDTQVLPRGLSVIEEPHRVRGMSSRPFDAEGLATTTRAIVDDGVLKTWTLDLATGRKLGLASTGNAGRGTSAPPSPTLTNVSLTQGTMTRDQLLAQMGTGLLVTSMIGSTISPTTGDYSRGASGFWVEGGQIMHPINECTLAGNLRDMLMRITPANDADPWSGARVPSLLVEGLTLAGN